MTRDELDAFVVRVQRWRHNETREYPYSNAELDEVIATARAGFEDRKRFEAQRQETLRCVAEKEALADAARAGLADTTVDEDDAMRAMKVYGDTFLANRTEQHGRAMNAADHMKANLLAFRAVLEDFVSRHTRSGSVPNDFRETP